MCCIMTNKCRTGLDGGSDEKSEYQQLQREGDCESEGAVDLGASSRRGCVSHTVLCCIYACLTPDEVQARMVNKKDESHDHQPREWDHSLRSTEVCRAAAGRDQGPGAAPGSCKSWVSSWCDSHPLCVASTSGAPA